VSGRPGGRRVHPQRPGPTYFRSHPTHYIASGNKEEIPQNSCCGCNLMKSAAHIVVFKNGRAVSWASIARALHPAHIVSVYCFGPDAAICILITRAGGRVGGMARLGSSRVAGAQVFGGKLLVRRVELIEPLFVRGCERSRKPQLSR